MIPLLVTCLAFLVGFLIIACRLFISNSQGKRRTSTLHQQGIITLGSPWNRLFGPRTSLRCSMPKVIWSYWEGPKDSLVEACLDRLAATVPPGWSFHLLDHSTALQQCPLPFPSWTDTSTLRADWLRVSLLATYGGVWVDASVIMIDHIETVLTPYMERASFFAFYNPLNMIKGSRLPVIEVSYLRSSCN